MGSLGVVFHGCGSQLEEPGNSTAGLPAQEDESGDSSAESPAEEDSASPTSPSTPSVSPSVVGSSQVVPFEDCGPSVAILTAGVDTGLAQCGNGVIHRPAAVTCPSRLPRSEAQGDGTQVCSDADCTLYPNGYCGHGGGQIINLQCLYGCTTDSDCGDDQLCVCGPDIGRCMAATCQTDGDCADGMLCAEWYDREGIGCFESPQYACQTPADECGADVHCPPEDYGMSCAVKNGQRSCEPIPGVACGRPFLVSEQPRCAALVVNADYRTALVTSGFATELNDVERAALGNAWADMGLMEHASIAAFARFTLQLLHLGAPSTLVLQSQAATADELRHAKLCFELASKALGRDVGPGPLLMDGALEQTDLASVLRLVIREGCIGETVAALEAAEAAAHTIDSELRTVIEQIGLDEQRHAALAWRFVAWALQQDPDLRALAQAEFSRALDDADPVLDAAQDPSGSAQLLAHGIVPPSLRSMIRRAAINDVIRPCAAQLLTGAASERVLATRREDTLGAPDSPTSSRLASVANRRTRLFLSIPSPR